MPWYALRPRDPADPRWPLPGRDRIVLKAQGPDEARAKFLEAYPSQPFGSPATPVPDAGIGSFTHEPEALLAEETDEPAAPRE